MKKRLLNVLGLALLGSWGFSSAWAQSSWLPPTVPGEDLSTLSPETAVYMYNVEADAFTTYGMDWNTHAIATKLTNGDKVASGPHKTYVLTATGGIKIKNNEKNNGKFLGGAGEGSTNDCWVDHAENNVFAYAETESGSRVYTLKPTTAKGEVNNLLDVSWNYGGHITYAGGKGFTTWAFVSEESVTNGKYALYKAKKALYSLYEACVSAGVTATYETQLATALEAYNAEDATDASVKAAAATLFKAVGDKLGNLSIDVSYLFADADMRGAASVANWSSSGSLSWGVFEKYHDVFTLTQTVNDLPKGKYTIIFHGLFRQDGSAVPVALTASSIGTSVTEPIVEMRTLDYGVTNGNNKNDWANKDGWIPNGRQSAGQALAHDGAISQITDIYVYDGSLKIAVNETDASQWVVFQGFDIAYNGNVMSKSDVDELLTKAEALKDKKMNVDVATALSSAIALGKAITETSSDEEVGNAFDKLYGAVLDAESSSANYAKLEAPLAYVAARIDAITGDGADKSAYTTLKQAYDEATIAKDADYDQYVTDIYASLTAAAKSQTATVGCDMTYAIQNNSFEMGNLNGWTVSGYSNDTGVKSTTDNIYKMENSEGSHLFNTWPVGVKLSQTVEGLPKGHYKLVFAYASDLNNILVISANGFSAKVTAPVGSGTATDITHYAKVGEDGKLTIETVQGNTNHWYKVDNFRLTVVSEEEYDNATASSTLRATIAKMTRLNAIMSDEHCMTLLADAQTMLDNAAEKSVEELNAMTQQLYTCLEGKTYAGLKDGGFEESTSGWTQIDGGDYGYVGTALYGGGKLSDIDVPLTDMLGANGGKAALLASGWGNEASYSQNVLLPKGTYVLSYEAYNAHTSIPITTQTSANGVASSMTSLAPGVWDTDVVQFTIDEPKEVTIKIGCKNEGPSNNFAKYWIDNVKLYQLPTTATVKVSDAKWATMILPFAAEKPENLTVYSCDKVVNNLLMLTTESSIAANTPYIVTAEAAADFEFTGQSIATKTSYTVGLLTGTLIDMTAEAGSYVLQKQGDKVAFYLVQDGNEPTITAGHAYLELGGFEANALFFPDMDDPTSAARVAADEDVVDVLTLSGVVLKRGVKASQARTGLKKGLYIIGGKATVVSE